MTTYKAKYQGYLSSSEVDSDEVNFSDNGVLKTADWLVYSYQSGSYEGDGVSIHKNNGKYYQSNLGHCSCYGPEDGIEEKVGYDSIEELLKNCTDSLKKELKCVLDFIRTEQP